MPQESKAGMVTDIQGDNEEEEEEKEGGGGDYVFILGMNVKAMSAYVKSYYANILADSPASTPWINQCELRTF